MGGRQQARDGALVWPRQPGLYFLADLPLPTAQATIVPGEVHDPDIEGSTITVTEVTLSPDLKLATCYVMPLGDADIAKTVEALDRNRKFLRGAVTKRVDLKFSPELRFRVDSSFETGERIDALLRSPGVRRDLGDDRDDS